MCVYTVSADEFSTFETVTYLSAVFLANTAPDVNSFVALLYGENTEYTIMMKTGRQFVKTVCLSGNIDFSLTLRAAKLSIPLADQCVFLYTLATECVQAGYCLGIGKSILTNLTSNLFFEIFRQRVHR